MKLYLFLSFTLTLVHRDFGKNIEIPNTQSTFNLTEDKVISNTESTLNSTENTEILTMERTSNLEENATMLISKNTSEPTGTTEFNWKDYFGFDEDEDATTEKIPEPNCPENMQPLFWIEEEYRWKCTCVEPFYHKPINNTCVTLFRQRPCEPGNFLIQPEIGPKWFAGPRCAPNPCQEDGLVPYNGTCLDTPINTVCEYGNPFFNETSSEIECRVRQARGKTVINAPRMRQNKCGSDSRVDKYGRCRRKL